MIIALIVGYVIVALLGIRVLTLVSQLNRQEAEITELQAAVDSIHLAHGLPTIFNERYGVEYVLDPTKLPPPDDAA